MENLPVEILWQIIDNLSRNDRLSLRRVNKKICRSLHSEVWTRIGFGTDMRGWTNINPPYAFSNMSHGEELLYVKEITIAQGVGQLDTDFTKFENLKLLHLELRDELQIPVKRILHETRQAVRHVKYIGARGQGYFIGEPLTSVSLKLTEYQLPETVRRLWGTPHVPHVSYCEIIDDGENSHHNYADVVAKVFEYSGVESLALHMGIINPFKVQWVPDSVKELSLDWPDRLAKPADYNLEPSTVENVTSLIASRPDIVLKLIRLRDGSHLDQLKLDNRRPIDEDDVEGRFYSNQERAIHESVQQFLPADTLTCSNLTLSFTAAVCGSVKRLTIDKPRTSASTTFNDFNGMLTRLAHHQLALLNDSCSNLEYLFIDNFFDFGINEGFEFLKHILGRNDQLGVIAVTSYGSLLPTPPVYMDCLREIGGDKLPPERCKNGTEYYYTYYLDIPRFKRFYVN